MRGGWKVGHRHKAIFIVSLILRHQKASDQEAKRVLGMHLHGMAQPPGDEISLEDCMKTFWSKSSAPNPERAGGISNQSISDSLAVTTDEASILSGPREGLTPWPPASGQEVKEAMGSLKENLHRRRECVLRVCEKMRAEGISPTAPEVVNHLAAEGWETNKVTVLRDMKVLGFQSRKGWSRSPDSQSRLFPR
jgi:hypothetical protein